MAGVTYNPGMETLRTALFNGAIGGDLTDVKAFMKALSGDIVLKVVPATAAPAPTAAAWTQTALVTLETADGERHKWYSGPVTLAIADTSTAGTATITPAAGAHYMTDGALTVTIAGDAAAWLATETATLTASIAAQHTGDNAILGYVVANKTCVITFTAA